uniref:ORF A protein n=1 Tax=Methanosarcina mazei TaxID=2209 RepID=Q50221_METMZ|nr:ORF A [Methanosarcina mazei]
MGSGAVSEAAISDIQQSQIPKKQSCKLQLREWYNPRPLLGTQISEFLPISQTLLSCNGLRWETYRPACPKIMKSRKITPAGILPKNNLYWSGRTCDSGRRRLFNQVLRKKDSLASWINDTLESSSVSDQTTQYPSNLTSLTPASTWNLPPTIFSLPMSGKQLKTRWNTRITALTQAAGLITSNRLTSIREACFCEKPLLGGTPEFETVEVHFTQALTFLPFPLKTASLTPITNMQVHTPIPESSSLKELEISTLSKRRILALFSLHSIWKKHLFRTRNSEKLWLMQLIMKRSYTLRFWVTGKYLTAVLCHLPWKTSRKPKNLSTVPEKARKTLVKAGYKESNGNGILEGKDGKDIKLEILIRPEYARTGELLENTSNMWALLQTCGLRIPIPGCHSRIITSMTCQYPAPPPWGMLMHASWGTATLIPEGRAGVIITLVDTEFLKLCDDVLAITDPEELQAYAYEIQDYYAENLPAVPLYWNSVVTPYNRHIEGWYTDPLYGIYNLDNFVNVTKIDA